LESRNDKGVSPLMLASSSSSVLGGAYESVEALLKAGAKVDATDSSGLTALHWAAGSRGNHKTVEVLLRYGADVHAKTTRDGNTPLHIAASRGSIPTVEILLANGASLSARNLGLQTPIEVAKTAHTERFNFTSEKAQQEMTRYLKHVSKGKSPSSFEKKPLGQKLYDAVKEGNLSLLESLLQRAKPKHVDFLAFTGQRSGSSRDGDEMEVKATALYLACEIGESECADLLIKKGANVETKLETRQWDNGLTPLLTAVKKQHAKCVELLLNAGSSANAVGPRGYSPLHLACQGQDVEIVKLLLSHKASVTYRAPERQLCEESGNQPLHVVSNAECAALVLERGGVELLEERNGHGSTPLHCAVKKGRVDCVRLYLKSGAAVDGRLKGKSSSYNPTPLYSAAISGMSECVRALLDGGADPELLTKENVHSKTNVESKPIHAAAKGGSPDCIRELLDRGVSVDSLCEANGNTPLHYVVSSLSHSVASHNKRNALVDCAELLISYGADVTIQTNGGKTALDIAQSPAMTNAARMGAWTPIVKKMIDVLSVKPGLCTKKACRNGDE